RSGWRDARIALRGRARTIRERRVVVGVDDVMREPGMIRLLSPQRLEDAGRLELPRVGLVRRRRSRGEGDGEEDLRLGVCRLLCYELSHRALVGEGARPLILVLEVVVELADGVDVAALPLGRARRKTRRRVGRLL